MVAARLKQLFFNQHDPHSVKNYQFAYRAEHSAPDQVSRILQMAHQAFADGNDTLLLNFDISAAFDTVWPDGLLYKLARIGVTGVMLKWMHA